MSYHNKSKINFLKAKKAQSELAPAGFHYMPDGTLMADSDMPSYLPEESQNSNIKCFSNTELSPEAPPFSAHCWSICNLFNCDRPPSWVAPSAPWISGQAYGPYGFMNNPFNPPGPWNVASAILVDAFYNWVVSQVGTVSVGDTIKFDMTAANSGSCNILGTCAQIICFKYEGYLPWNNGIGLNNFTSGFCTAQLYS